MAKRQTAKTANTIRTRDNGKPESMVATLTTLDAIIAFAVAHVNATNIVALIAIVRDTFARGVFNKNVGRTTGWRVTEFQNRLLALAYAHNPRPTLVQLVFIGACEFPGAVGRIFAPIIPVTGGTNVDMAVSQWSGVVTLFNAGKHANMIPPSPVSFEPGIERAPRTRTTPAPVVTPEPVKPVVNAKTPRLVKRSRAS